MKKYAEVLYMIKRADLKSALAQIRKSRALIGRKDTQVQKLLKKPPTPLNRIKDTVNWDPNAIQSENTHLPLPKGMQDGANVGRFTGSNPVDPEDHIAPYDYMQGFGNTPSALRSRLDANSRKLYGTDYATQRRKGSLQSAWKNYDRKHNNLLGRKMQKLPNGKWIGQLDPESYKQLDKINHDEYLRNVDQINKQHDFSNREPPTNDQQREQQRMAQIQQLQRQRNKNRAQMQQLSKNTPKWQKAFQDNNKKQLAKATMMNRPGSAVTFMSDKDPAFAQYAYEEAKRQGISTPTVDAGGQAQSLNPVLRQKIFDQGYTLPGAEQAKNFQQIPESQIKQPTNQSIQQVPPSVPPPANGKDRNIVETQNGIYKMEYPPENTYDSLGSLNQQPGGSVTVGQVPVAAKSVPPPAAPGSSSVQPVSQRQSTPVQPKTPAAAPAVSPQGTSQTQNTQNQQVTAYRPANRINYQPASEAIRNTQKQQSSDPNYVLPDRVAVPTASGGKIWVSRKAYINRPQGTQGIARAKQEQTAYAQNNTRTWQSPNKRQLSSNRRTFYRYGRGRTV